MPLRAWPLSLDEIGRYYRRAHAVFGLGPRFFDDRLWPVFGEEPPRFDTARLRTRFWQFRSPQLFPLVSPLRFGTTYRGAFKSPRNVDVVLNATAVRIATSEGRNHIAHLELRSLGARTAQVRARSYLLACGAIENARLMMVSGFGEGDGRGMLGRCFTEHPHVTIGTVETENPARLEADDDLRGRLAANAA